MAKRQRTTTIALSAADLREAVAEWAQRKGLISGGTIDVDIEIHTQTTGYGMAERDERVGRVVLREVHDG